MPDRMPNRMSEDMSDRMPEDLPVRKCINVMVGITRSKVIIYSMTQRMTPVHGEQFSKHYEQTGHHGENHRIPGTEGQ